MIACVLKRHGIKPPHPNKIKKVKKTILVEFTIVILIDGTFVVLWTMEVYFFVCNRSRHLSEREKKFKFLFFIIALFHNFNTSADSY